MRTSPSNIIEGLVRIVVANRSRIDEIVSKYRSSDSLHLFKGLRKTLPMTSFPSLEMDISDGSMSWVTTSAQSGRYSIDCVLTVNCGTCIDLGVEYISELTRMIVGVFNDPVNMTWEIPGEGDDDNKTLCQYSSVGSVSYGYSRDFSLRVARWTIECMTVEAFPHPGSLIGPVESGFPVNEPAEVPAEPDRVLRRKGGKS